MITELKLSNFRLFSDEVTVRFRPITVMIGRNSAGKSSIIKFLLMLQQSLGPGSEYLVSHGSSVKLGKFDQLKNKVRDKQNLQFCLSLKENSSPPDIVRQYLEDKKMCLDDERTYHAKANVRYGDTEEFLGEKQEISLSVAGKSVVQKTEHISPNISLFGFIPETLEQKPELDIVKHGIEIFRYDISELRYLSENKRELTRTIDIGEKLPIRSVGSSGEYTLHQLRTKINNNEEAKKILYRHAKKVLNIGSIIFRKSDEFAQCSARNIKTKATHNIAEFGFGVSQCMPIFIQGLLMLRGTSLIASQPESHIHPTAHLELGSFFADLWKIRGVRSIIETHSDNILLRLRRLIAKGELKAEDVSVAFFDIDEHGNPSIKNLDINEDGSVQEGLPIEFFHANFEETLKMQIKE